LGAARAPHHARSAAKSATSYQRRLAAIDDAQRHGRVTATLTPVQILAVIESLATTMAFQAKDDDELQRNRDTQRKAVTEGLRRMLANAGH
jgi:hypothetical protein